MEKIIPLVITLAVIFFDLSIFRKQDEALFRKIFSFPRWLAVLYPLAGLAVALFWGRPEYFSAFFFLFIFPVYLLRRRRFRKFFYKGDQVSEYVVATPSHLALVSDAISLLWVWFFGIAGIVVAIGAIQEFFPDAFSELGEMLVIAFASSVLLIFLIYRTIKNYPGLSFSEAVGLKKENQSWHKIFTIPALLGLAVAAVTSYLALSREVQPSTPMGDVLEANNGSMMLLAFMLMAVILAPILEEIIFRGYFFYVISRYRGQTVAVYLIAVVFALLHVEQYWGDWLAIFMVAFLGLILSHLRVWTKTTIATMVTHFFYNATMTIFPVILVVTANPTYYQYQQQYQTLDFDGKEKLLQASIERNPKFPESYNDLAWLYVETDVNLEEALDLVNKALELYPRRFAYLDTKAEVLYKMGRMQEAINIAEDLVQRYPREKYAKDQLRKFHEALIKEYGGEIAGP